MTSVSRNKVCLKGTKISGYGRHKKESDDGNESPKMLPTAATLLG
jgi:hypothetical protein